jgi:2-methylcitrate dehydratase PrpD
MGVTETLARLAIETPGDALPDEAIRSAKLRILDTIGIALAGSREESTRIALETVRHMGGNPTASVIGHADRTSAPLAGYVNGTSAHSQEFDDYTKGVAHASVAMVPGALALAEERGLSGRALLEGFIVGFEVESRVARGLRPALLDRGWHPNGVVGAIGVAAAGARMWGLDVMRTRMALAVAASEASGLRKNVGSMGKAFHVGHGVRNGIFAALLAERGYKMDPDIIEPSETAVAGHESFGLAETFSGADGYDLSRMTDRLGERWELAENTTIVCFHPGSTAPAAAIDAALDVVSEHDLRPADIDRIDLEVTPPAYAMACYPEAPDPYRARYCLPWSVAVAVIDRRASLPQYSEERIARGDVQAFMPRVAVSVPPDFAHHKGQWGVDGVNWAETRIAFHMKDGRVLRHARSYARGWSEEPAGWDDIEGKFRECAEGVLSPSRCDNCLTMISNLESVEDITMLMEVLRIEEFSG